GRIHQESEPRLVLRLEPAAPLADARYPFLEQPFIVVARRRFGRIPEEKRGGLVVGRVRTAGGHPCDEVSGIVRVALVAGLAEVAAAEARRNDPDVNVVDGRKLSLEAVRAALTRCLRLRGRRDAL